MFLKKTGKISMVITNENEKIYTKNKKENE